MLNTLRYNKSVQIFALLVVGVVFFLVFQSLGTSSNKSEMRYEESAEKLKHQVTESQKREKETKKELDDAKEEIESLRVELKGFAELNSKAGVVAATCPYEFVSYTSSPMEQTWIDNIDNESWNRHPCAHFDQFRAEATKWSEWTTERMMKDPKEYSYDDKIFSTFLYKDCKGNEIKIPIEPMALAVRHPLMCTNGGYLLDKNYLAIDWQQKKMWEAAGKPKILYYDLGASTWDQGGGGPSQSWFAAIYEQRGLTFDDMYMWEVTPHDAKNVFALLPAKYMAVYHWFNIPASPEKGNKANPYTVLLDRAKKEDFVVYKLDIDTPSVELPLVQQLLDDPSLASLIDEMYFEHHVNFDTMNPSWGTANEPTSLKDTFDIFIKLRQMGIRIHSWV